MGPRSPDLHYVPYGDLGRGVPSVVVDGSPAEGTVLCLSHWPGIGSPPEFAADLSAEMAFAYLGAFDRHDGATAVSNNHFDQDGLVSVFALASPGDALARHELLVEVARAGDFAVTRSRAAARVSMVVSAFADPERSPLRGLPADDDEMTAVLYGELLGRLPELCDRPDRFRNLWAEEDATLHGQRGGAGLGRGDDQRGARRRPRRRDGAPERAPSARGPPLRWAVGVGAAPDGPVQRHRSRRAARRAGPALRVRPTATRVGCSSGSRRVRARVDLAPLAETAHGGGERRRRLGRLAGRARVGAHADADTR